MQESLTKEQGHCPCPGLYAFWRGEFSQVLKGDGVAHGAEGVVSNKQRQYCAQDGAVKTRGTKWWLGKATTIVTAIPTTITTRVSILLYVGKQRGTVMVQLCATGTCPVSRKEQYYRSSAR